MQMLAPEARLLALTAGGARNDSGVAELLALPLDEYAVRRLVLRERAAGPLVRSLRRMGGAPALAVADSLGPLARLSDIQSVFLHGRLLRVQKALAERGIDVLLLKGAALAHTMYHSPLERPMGDLDLLVPPERAAEAVEVALGTGWVCRTDLPAGSDYGEHHHLVPLEDDQGSQVGLEFHVELFSRQSPFLLPASQLWRAARPVSSLGSRVWVPERHHQLLHVCLHFAWSDELQFGAWRALRDIDVLVASGVVDWRRFVDVAVASRGATCCYWSLRLARDLAGVPVPEPVLARLAPVGPPWVLDSIARHFAQTCLPVTDVCPSVTLSRALWRMGVQPKLQRHGRARPWLDPTGAAPPGTNGQGSAKPGAAARLGQLTGYIVNLLPPSRGEAPRRSVHPQRIRPAPDRPNLIRRA